MNIVQSWRYAAPYNSWYATRWQGGYVGGQWNRIFSRRIYMKTEFSSPEERNAFVLDHQHGRRDVTCKPAIHMGILFMGVWVGEGGVVLNPVSLVLELRGSKRSTIAVHSCPVRFKPRWTRATGPEYFLAVVLCRNNIQEIFKGILMVVVYWRRRTY